MLNPRWMRANLSRWMPEALKRRFRARLFGYGAPSVPPGTVELRDGIVHAEFRGIQLRAPAAAYDDLRYHLVGNADSIVEMEAVLRAANDPGGMLLDVGAARGVISAMFCLARPGNFAVAYEPARGQALDARELLLMNGVLGMEVRDAAVGASLAMLQGREDALGLIDLSPPDDAETFAVYVTTLDREIERFGIPGVVKIDVEGHELEVLRGAPKLLREHRPVILLELHLDMLETRGIRPAEVVDILRAAGYRFETCAGEPLAAPENSPKAVLRLVARPAA